MRLLEYWHPMAGHQKTGSRRKRKKGRAKHSYILWKFRIIIFACLFIAGCVSSKYSPPILSQELEYTSEIAEKYNVDEDWWKQYNCQELDRLLAMALANNPDYLKAALNIEKELASLNIANADLIPTFYANLAASTQKELKRGHASSQNYSGSLGLNYELDLYGKIRDASSTQEFEYKATMMDQAAARLSLINSVVDLYFNLEYLSNFITLTEQNIKIYQDLMAITTEKHKHGKVDNLTLIQARQSLIAEESQLLELKTQFQELEQSLRNILRLKPSETLICNILIFSAALFCLSISMSHWLCWLIVQIFWPANTGLKKPLKAFRPRRNSGIQVYLCKVRFPALRTMCAALLIFHTHWETFLLICPF
jgi:hypothetical protein